MNFTVISPHDMSFKSALEAILPGLSSNLGLAVSLDETCVNSLFNLVLGRACQPQHIRNIMLGREALVELPRQWVLDRIEKAAFQLLNLDDDDWQYRRLLEVAEKLDASLLARLVQKGLASANPNVVEASSDYI